MSNGAGLKGQWGVGDPAKAGSDKQSQQFQASFQGHINGINNHLQYTSANADAARHDPLAGRRDALYPAFQSALGQIDRTNPAKAQGAIDKVLADGKALGTEAAALCQSARKALTDWKARQPKYDAAVHQVEELEAWGDPKAALVRALVDRVRTETNQRTYAQAVLIVDQLLPKLKPLYDDYQKQKAAKPKHEQALAEQTARLDALKAAERPSQPMTGKIGEADGELGQARWKGDAKDYVGGSEQMKAAQTAIDGLDKLAKDPQRVKFLADRKAAEEALNAPADATFKTLEADWTAILQLRDQSDPMADSGDYAGANKLLADVKVKLDAFKKKLEEIKKQKQAYDDALAPLQPKLTAAAQSKYAKLALMQQDIAAVQGQMETAAQNEDFVQALKLAQDLVPKMDAFDKALTELEQQKKEYDDALAALQPQLQEALKSAYAPLKPKVDEITRVKGEMEAAAQKEDFVAALQALNDLKAKVEAFLPDLQKLQQAEKDYTAARAALKPKLDDALVQAREFKADAALTAARTALVTADSAVETAAAAQDFEQALLLVKDLETKVVAYLASAQTKQAEYQKKGEDVVKKLDAADWDDRDDLARKEIDGMSPDVIQHLPTPIRNRLLAELQEGNFEDADKAACKKLYSVTYLDPEFQKLDDASRKKMIDKIKSDPAFKTARDNWAGLNEKQRVEIMQKAVDHQAEAYGIPKTTIKTYSKDDPTDFGFYRHSDGKLHINAHDAALKNGGFDEAIDTAVHENGHRYQHMLIDKLNADPPEIKPGDPLYNQAMTFKLNEEYYVQPLKKGKKVTPNTGPEYSTQPMENHSRITGTQVQAAGIGK